MNHCATVLTAITNKRSDYQRALSSQFKELSDKAKALELA
jgi:hypothetical protein